MLNDKFLKPYNPQEEESKIYKIWEESGFFNPDTCVDKGVSKPDADSFSMVLPPPNATGTLHMGSALMLVIEDILARFHRMRGLKTLWLPGTDHASIATESKVASLLSKEGKRKHDLGREGFLSRVGDFVRENQITMLKQMRAIGSSLDWSRLAFTLDDKRSYAVKYAFKKMYDDGLIYRKDRITNWDPKGQTTISDDEIVYKEEKTTFYYLKYGPFTIGTSRPETKFGDKYVVMHPNDERYAEYKHGQEIKLEWINGPVSATVIKDEAIDMEFGSGVMTITPWHDTADFEIAERHKLDKEQVIDEYGKLLPLAGEFAGMKIADARLQIIEKLRSKGLLVKEETYTHNVATAERTGGIVEPQIKLQWFVNVNKPVATRGGRTLKELMREPVEKGEIKIVPDYFNKTYFYWIENLRDWCISRQIWYGHRIPVWYKGEEIYVGIEAPEGDGWTQDPDTLDTWFSSALWPFSTLGWPENTKDIKNYYPTTVLETGYDILFFWVARMILMSSYHLGQVPFRTVYLHGLVRDMKGQKISKSLGNNIDPSEMIEKYGADAVRMSLIVGTGPGNDSKMSEYKIRANKHFANKIWNAARFVLENTPSLEETDETKITGGDEGLLKEWRKTVADITGDLEEFRFHIAAEKLYHYFWHTFADIIIEKSKLKLRSENVSEKVSAENLLRVVLEENLKVLHPFMPFVTETIWQNMKKEKLLMVEMWPPVASR